MSSVVRLGLLVTRAVWPGQREVPYATMENPPAAYASSNQANPPLPPPGTQSQQTPVKAEEPGCLCGAMTLARGAIVVGIAQIVIYLVTVPTVIVLLDKRHPALMAETHSALVAETHPALVAKTHPALVAETHPALVAETHVLSIPHHKQRTKRHTKQHTNLHKLLHYLHQNPQHTKRYNQLHKFLHTIHHDLYHTKPRNKQRNTQRNIQRKKQRKKRAHYYKVLATMGVFHLTWNILLIVGARTGGRRLVRSWIGYHAAKMLVAVGGVIYLLVVLSRPPKASWGVRLGVSVFFAALLVLEGYFLSVGVRLSRRLTADMSTLAPAVVVVAQSEQVEYPYPVSTQPGKVVYPYPVIQPPPYHQQIQHSPHLGPPSAYQ